MPNNDNDYHISTPRLREDLIKQYEEMRLRTDKFGYMSTKGVFDESAKPGPTPIQQANKKIMALEQDVLNLKTEIFALRELVQEALALKELADAAFVLSGIVRDLGDTGVSEQGAQHLDSTERQDDSEE